ncbi:MAG: hypothetical protein H7Z72_08090, partial [Bacteroidetes bacterium]|nr:hypothetical protein [Fibrella sp.]
MFDLNPLDMPDAALQQWIMLFGAGTLGYIIGYISRKVLIDRLEGDLAVIDRTLDDCRQLSDQPLSTRPDDTGVLNRIKARAGEIDLTRIGVATADEADALQAIVGVGPFLERKLHAIGIYTFRQIANFSKDDVEQVNEIIEFFPGRIERD